MKTRWMNRRNETTGADERFYPITHTDAIIGLEEWTSSEVADVIMGEDPEMSPSIAKKFEQVDQRLNDVENEISDSVARLALI